MKNITIKKLFSLPSDQFNEYVELFEMVKPIDYINTWPDELEDPFRCKGLRSLTVGEVIEIKMKLHKDVARCIEIAFGIKKERVHSLRVKSFFPALNFIKKEIKDIIESEAKFLKGQEDADLKQAGVDRLNVFGDMNMFFGLMKDFPLVFSEDQLKSNKPINPFASLEKIQYSIVFAYLYHQRISNEVQKKYSEIIRNKK